MDTYRAGGQGSEPSGDRLSKLREAALRINENLDFDDVLQDVIDSARALISAQYGVITTLDASGQMEGFLTSGMTIEEVGSMRRTPQGMEMFRYLSGLSAPLRVPDLPAHARSVGMVEYQPTLPIKPFLLAPILHQRENMGHIYLVNGPGGAAFNQIDEDTLVMFAAQVALVIANARKYRDEQLARADLETVIAMSPVGIAVFNGGMGTPPVLNFEALRILRELGTADQSPEELIKALTIRHDDGQETSLEEFLVAHSQSWRDGVPAAEEVVIRCPDGRSLTTLANASLIHSEKAEVESVVATLQDMTSLEELEKLRAEFVGMVSHELRQPLTSIKGSADVVLESLNSLDPVEVAQFIRIIKSQAERMHALINELLDIARLETGTLSLTPEPTDVAEPVDEAKSAFLIEHGSRHLIADIETDLPLVMADKRRITQVLSNLLSNAARYSHETSTIRLESRVDDDYVAISVVDEGRGVSAEQLPLLFRKFSRVNSDKQERETTGSGLGLAICKGIVEALGGRIWVESGGLGQGSRFTFTVPVVKEASADVANPISRCPAKDRQEERGQIRVLAVDDDPIVLGAVRDALSKAGCLPVVSTDPDEVLQLVETERFSLVLLDLMMPGCDGIDLMQSIHIIADVPVIFLSAYGRDEIIARALEAGASDYVVKPFSPTELMARVRTAIRQRRSSFEAEPYESFLLGDLTIDYTGREVLVAQRPVHLTTTEYELLVELSTNAGRVLTHDQLLKRVWGLAHPGGKGTVSTFVKRLRQKLGDDANHPTYIFSVPRIGYRMAKGE